MQGVRHWAQNAGIAWPRMRALTTHLWRRDSEVGAAVESTRADSVALVRSNVERWSRDICKGPECRKVRMPTVGGTHPASVSNCVPAHANLRICGETTQLVMPYERSGKPWLITSMIGISGVLFVHCVAAEAAGEGYQRSGHM